MRSTFAPASPFVLHPRHRLHDCRPRAPPSSWSPRRSCEQKLVQERPQRGPQFLRGDEANRQTPLPSYVVLNAGASARWRGLEGFVNIYNLLNHRYQTFGTFAPDARLEGSPVVPFVTPAPPINVAAGLRYTF